MDYQSVADTAKAWNLSERTVRNYCASGKIPGAVLTGKTWNIPQDAKRPERINKKATSAPRPARYFAGRDDRTRERRDLPQNSDRSHLQFQPH